MPSEKLSEHEAKIQVLRFKNFELESKLSNVSFSAIEIRKNNQIEQLQKLVHQLKAKNRLLEEEKKQDEVDASNERLKLLEIIENQTELFNRSDTESIKELIYFDATAKEYSGTSSGPVEFESVKSSDALFSLSDGQFTVTKTGYYFLNIYMAPSKDDGYTYWNMHFGDLDICRAYSSAAVQNRIFIKL